jgi:hypothetical protein
MNEAVSRYKTSKIYVFTLEGIVIDEKGKKKMIGMPQWKQINHNNFSSYCFNHHRALAVLTGKTSCATFVDIDLKDGYCAYDDVMNDFPELRDCYTVKTWSGGYHVYCLYDAEIKTTTNAYECYKNIDIRNDDAIVFAPPTKVFKKPGGCCGIQIFRWRNFALPNGIKK